VLSADGSQAAAFAQRRPSLRPHMARPRHSHVCAATTLEFIKGIEEPTIPDVRLTRSRDGASGIATFVFDNPAIFEASSELGDITGLYMTDDEGTITTVEVQAKFVNGKPSKIEAKYVMRSNFEWDRFMVRCILFFMVGWGGDVLCCCNVCVNLHELYTYSVVLCVVAAFYGTLCRRKRSWIPRKELRNFETHC
jgi:photosystem II 13kDa protein